MSTFIFYFLSVIVIYGAINTVVRKNPVTSALHLSLTMIALAGFFFHLGARFIAGVQIAVYSGAVMVLFVMVIMLFDTKSFNEFSAPEKLSNFLKLVSSASVLGLLAGIIPHSVGLTNKIQSPEVTSTKLLAYHLFSKYVFIFEWLGLLLLVIAVGVVVLTRNENLKENQKNTNDFQTKGGEN